MKTIGPGVTALTRIPLGANSIAATFFRLVYFLFHFNDFLMSKI